jgi:hypothetical protein
MFYLNSGNINCFIRVALCICRFVEAGISEVYELPVTRLKSYGHVMNSL